MLRFKGILTNIKIDNYYIYFYKININYKKNHQRTVALQEITNFAKTLETFRYLTSIYGFINDNPPFS